MTDTRPLRRIRTQRRGGCERRAAGVHACLCEKLPLATAARQKVFHTAWQKGQRLHRPAMAAACGAPVLAVAAAAPSSTRPSLAVLQATRHAETLLSEGVPLTGGSTRSSSRHTNADCCHV